MTVTVVASEAAFNTATAAAQAGDIIKVASGTYSNWAMTVPASGAAGNKILIQPQNANGVTFTTTSSITVTGNYITISDFNFTNATNVNVDIQGNFNQLTLCDFDTCGDPASLHQPIIRMQLGASDNEIDHNTMVANQGVGIQVKIPQNIVDPMPYRNWIHHNTISNVANLPGQGQEPIQLGQTNEGAPNELYCLVERNTFVSCAGDTELISVKTSKATVRYNKASDCDAHYSLRQGHGNTLDSNVNLRSTSGGISVTGSDHIVINNFIDAADLQGILIAVGSSQYPAATNCTIAHNTVINTATPAEFSLRDPTMTDLPSGNKIVNNILNGNVSPDLALGLHDNNVPPQTTLAACLAANLVDHNLMTGDVSTYNTGTQVNYSGTETLDLTDPYTPRLPASDTMAHDKGLAGYAAVDIAGSLRAETNAPPDIGAYELASPVSLGGGGGHKKRTARYFRGKFIGTFTDKEFTEYMLAFLAAEVPAEEIQPVEPPKRKRKQIEVVEPEPFEPLKAADLVDIEPKIIALMEKVSRRKKLQALQRLLRAADEEHMMIALLH